MTPSDIGTLSRLLDELLELDDERARRARLDALPQAERHLRPALEQMLAELADGALPPLTLPELPTSALAYAGAAGERVGPYRLLRELGRGGMGSVWLAERADGAFERQVALKLPRITWTEGLDRRIARERRIGALLEHPNIARLYDAGLDAHGRPYLAMELVDGVPIDEYVRSRRLSVHDTVALVAQVARAAAYAHGRLVIHRDIKPSNVLVDDAGRSHLLDFGVAKLLASGTEDGALTQEQGVAFTPDYAAPEQLAGLPVGVQADVYALGMLLFELLTDTLPFPRARPTPSRPALAAPSGAAPRASGRIGDAARARAVRGDLDAVIGKALERDLEHRYASTEALADDLERYLRRVPVRALAQSRFTRLRRAVRRHAWAIVGGALIAGASATGFALFWLQAREAREAQQREALVRSFVTEVFRADPNGRATDARVELGARQIEQRYAHQPEAQAQLFEMTARVLSDMGVNLLAAAYARRHVAALEALHAPAREQARAQLALAEMLTVAEQLADAERAADRAAVLFGGDLGGRADAMALGALARLHGGRTEDLPARVEAVRALLARLPDTAPRMAHVRLDWVAVVAAWQGSRFDEAQAPYRRALAAALAVEGPNSAAARDMVFYMSYFRITMGRGAEARAEVEPLLATLAGADGSTADFGTSARTHLWRLLYDHEQIDFAAAADTLGRTRQRLHAQAHVPPIEAAWQSFNEGLLLVGAGRIDEGAPMVRTSMRALDAAQLSPGFRFEAEHGAALAAMLEGRFTEAEQRLARMHQVRIAMGSAQMPMTEMDHVLGARAAWWAGRWEEAVDRLARAVPARAEPSDAGRGHRYAQALATERAALELARGHVAEAQALLHDLPPTPPGALPDTGLFSLDALRAEVACASGRAAEGLAQLRPLLAARLARGDPATDALLARLRSVAAECALQAGALQAAALQAGVRHAGVLDAGAVAEARRWATEAEQAFARQPGVLPWFEAPLRRVRARLAALDARASRSAARGAPR